MFRADVDDITWAKNIITGLYREESSLNFSELAKWSLAAVSSGPSRETDLIGRSGCMDLSEFLASCERCGLILPKIFRTPPPAQMVFQNIPELMDYIEFVALRRHPGTGMLAYFVPAVLRVSEGLPSQMLDSPMVGKDPRAGIFGPKPSLQMFDWKSDTDFMEGLKQEWGDTSKWRRLEMVKLFVERPDLT